MATQRAQELLGNTKCDTCDTYKDVIWRCLNCQETLCNQCKTYHLRSKATRNHTVTELANTTEENPGTSIFCHEHENEAFQKYCESCNTLVCLECIIGTHMDHEFKQIEDITMQYKTQLEAVFEWIKTKQIPELEQFIVFIIQIQENYSQEIERLTAEMTNKGEKLKEVIDELIHKLTAELMQQAAKDGNCLKETKEQIERRLTTLKTHLSEEEQRVQKCNNFDIIVNAHSIKDSLSKITENSPDIPSVQPPRFQNGEENEEDLEKMIGKLVLEKRLGKQQEETDQTQCPVDHDGGKEGTISHKLNQDEIAEKEYKPKQDQVDLLSTKDKNPTAKSPNEKEKSQTDKSISHDTKMIKGKIVYSYTQQGDVKKIKVLNHNEAWLLKENISKSWPAFQSTCTDLELVNYKGQCMRSHKLDFHIEDMATKSSGELLVTYNYSIKRVSRSGNIDIFADFLPYSTHGIHVTQEGDVLVGLYDWGRNKSRVTRLSSTGQTLQVIDNIKMVVDKDKPYRITENVNHDIVMICAWSYILVIDKDGRYMFTYTGSPTHINTTGKFKPTDIVCNQSGQILVADGGNNNIHVLDKDGVFRKFILNQEPKLEVQALDIDTTGKLWIGVRNGQVAIVELS